MSCWFWTFPLGDRNYVAFIHCWIYFIKVFKPLTKCDPVLKALTFVCNDGCDVSCFHWFHMSTRRCALIRSRLCQNELWVSPPLLPQVFQVIAGGSVRHSFVMCAEKRLCYRLICLVHAQCLVLGIVLIELDSYSYLTATLFPPVLLWSIKMTSWYCQVF